jgi:hypothetical protein
MPPNYGKAQDWSPYSVHDAANVLKLYFDSLPEPVVPLSHYGDFSEPLRGHNPLRKDFEPVGVDPLACQGFVDDATQTYQELIDNLPACNRQLLLYMLDFIASFLIKTDTNKVTPVILAGCFQRGIFSHPEYSESRFPNGLGKDMVVFLMKNQFNFRVNV